MGGGLWFSTHPRDQARARSWCMVCPVSTDCLDHATTHDEWGIWGGLDQRERRLLKRRRRVA
jgi:WhiB family redox-sensing transcriptional regulator